MGKRMRFRVELSQNAAQQQRKRLIHVTAKYSDEATLNSPSERDPAP